ncbi:MAG: homogentisate 1,2-dioxygenase [Planctomycetes bacterium]|nr:homogentisate 1,2-dioxygenase [Planctomycetota bacterium]
MPQYLTRGLLPAKRHIAHRTISGYLQEGIYYEEVISTEGFHRAYSIAYHLRPPTRVLKINAMAPIDVELAKPETLRHIHLKTAQIPRSKDAVHGRLALFENNDLRIGRCRPAVQQNILYRNASQDELWFIRSGSGRLLSMFGAVAFRDLDYLVIPRCTTVQIEFDEIEQADMLVVESKGTIGFPGRYLNPDGQFRLGAPLCERDLRGPELVEPIDQEGEFVIHLRDGDRWSEYVLANHPFDVVGWDGMVYPYAFNAMDFEPITGTVHQPPPIHQTFQTDGFVVCTFAPRMLDTHPDAIKVPYAHSNVESDELLYYVAGNFGSRRGVELDSITLHPHGIPHGPHPGTIAASKEAKRTDELAVMIDTFRPLHRTKASLALDDPSYPFSWI